MDKNVLQQIVDFETQNMPASAKGKIITLTSDSTPSEALSHSLGAQRLCEQYIGSAQLREPSGPDRAAAIRELEGAYVLKSVADATYLLWESATIGARPGWKESINSLLG